MCCRPTAGSVVCFCTVIERKPLNLLSRLPRMLLLLLPVNEGPLWFQNWLSQRRRTPQLVGLFLCRQHSVSEIYRHRECWHQLLSLTIWIYEFLLQNGKTIALCKDGECMCECVPRDRLCSDLKDRIHNREPLKKEKVQMRPRGRWFSNRPFPVSNQFMTSWRRHVSTQQYRCFEKFPSQNDNCQYLP